MKRLLVISFATLLFVAAYGAGRAGDFSQCHLSSDAQDELRSAVASRGLDWQSERAGVMRFVSEESIASGIDDLAIARAMSSLLANFSLNDVEQIVAVLEEASDARSVSLAHSVDAVTAAVNGDSDQLIALDPHVRPLLAANAHLSTILERMHKDYAHAFASPSVKAAQAAQELKLRCTS